MPASQYQGLEITFSVPLHKTQSGVSPGGAVFFHQFLKRYDLEGNTIVLREDFDVFQSLTREQFLLFRGAAPDAVEFWVGKGIVRQIKDIGSGKIVFPV
ncbi:MAG: hypothetical protein HYT22_00025 [Candidatus Niyogibacteria bacterium]|nr:hypothetical protein [Candidatus Niyogibacteria bacterium]